MTSPTRVLVLAAEAGAAQRVPVLALADALRTSASVEIRQLDSDADIDAALDQSADARLVVAGGEGPLRAVLRRMVRRSLPRAGVRPADLPDDRTVPDLPPIGVLPLGLHELATALGLPTEPSDVAKAVLSGAVMRYDLLRNDGGSVTLRYALVGGSLPDGRPAPWAARIDLDHHVLSDGTEPLLACAVVNAGTLEPLAGLSLVSGADPTDGLLDVAVAVPVVRRGRPTTVEVRRARGRAVSVATESVPFVDDGVPGTLTRKRTWWMERAAWAAYRI